MALVGRMVAIDQDRPPIWRWYPISMNTSPPPILLVTLEAVLERVTYANEETGYTVARVTVRGSKDLLTVVGNLLGTQPSESLRLQGLWKSHPQYGRQIAYQTGVLDQRPPFGCSLLGLLGRVVRQTTGSRNGLHDRDGCHLSDQGAEEESVLDHIDEEIRCQNPPVPPIGRSRLKNGSHPTTHGSSLPSCCRLISIVA